MYKGWSADEIHTPTYWNLTGCSVIAPPPVIAQQYSAAIVGSLRFHSHSKRVAPPKHALSCVSLKLQCGSECTHLKQHS
jgi:hypothetical protein